jgi:hypothetical protein
MPLLDPVMHIRIKELALVCFSLLIALGFYQLKQLLKVGVNIHLGNFRANLLLSLG